MHDSRPAQCWQPVESRKEEGRKEEGRKEEGRKEEENQLSALPEEEKEVSSKALLARFPHECQEERISEIVDDQELHSILRKVAERALHPENLDQRLSKLHSATEEVSAISIFWSSQPVTLALTRWPGLSILAFAAAALLGMGSFHLLSGLAQLDRMQGGFRSFRFDLLSLRDGGEVRGAAIYEMGFLYNGWPLRPDFVDLNGTSLVVRFDEEIMFNGHYWSSIHGVGSQSPNTYRILQLDEAKQEWEEVLRHECLKCTASGPLSRNVLVDHRPHIATFIDAAYQMACGCMLLFVILVSKVLRNPSAARQLMFCIACFHTLFFAALNVWGPIPGFACYEEHSLSCYVLSIGIFTGLSLAFTLFYDRFVYWVLDFLTCFGLGWACFFTVRFLEGGRTSHLLYVVLVAMPAFCCGLWFRYKRWSIIKQACDLVHDDRHHYDRAFDTLMSLEGEDVRGLTEETRRIIKSIPRDVATVHLMPTPDLDDEFQRTNSLSSKASGDSTAIFSSLFRSSSLSLGFGGSSTESNLVTSLDVLYSQATVLDSFLRNRVQIWASTSRGYFNVLHTSTPSERKHSLVLWTEVQQDATLVNAIKWAKIKSSLRAIEKIVRCYRGCVAKLVDVTRQSIVFETVKDIRDCVLAIVRDPFVQVRRLQNRLDPDWDSSVWNALFNLGCPKMPRRISN